MRRMLIKELGNVITGNTPSMKNVEFYDSNDIGFVKPDVFKSSRITHIYSTNAYISENARNKARIVKKDTVLITCIGSIGKVGITDGVEFSFNQQINAIEPNNKVVPKYLAYNILSNKNRLMDIANAPVVPIINKTQFENFDIVINENTEEQKRIVKILDQTNEIITLRKNQLNELDSLIKSRFVEMFGESGKEVPLIDYVWFQEGPGVRSVDFTEDGCVLLTGSNINDNEITFGYKSDRFVSKELAEGKYSHFICDEGDILVVTSAVAPEKFDKKVVVIEKHQKYCLNTGIIRFKPNLKCMTKGYFREFLKSVYFKKQVLSEMRGIAQMHFGPSHLNTMTILLPDSLDMQIEFENFVHQVDKLKLEVKKSLDETQVLFDSLMQEYFK